MENSGIKKLCKSRTDKKLCGVCGGLAKYLECDPAIVRIITVLLSLAYGGGLIAYIVGALVMPFEEDVAE